MKTLINKSDLFKSAWARFKANKTRITFARSLKMAWEFAKEQAGYVVEEVKPVAKTTAQIIQTVKETLLQFTTKNAQFRHNYAIMCEVAEDVVSYVADLSGFAGDVAKTVDKYGKISEKQAYIIARAAVEQNKLGQHTNFFLS